MDAFFGGANLYTIRANRDGTVSIADSKSTESGSFSILDGQRSTLLATSAARKVPTFTISTTAIAFARGSRQTRDAIWT